MRLLIAFLFLMFVADLCNAQSTKSSNEGLVTYSNSFSKEVKRLADSLVIKAQTDKERLTAIYKYVINNISYDKSAYKNGLRRINKSNLDVLRRKKAVCWGYAELIREMSTHVGILCYSVTGYAIDLKLPIRSFEKANHAWNAVRLDGIWYLLDATWDSGVGPEEDYFMSIYDVDYFLTPPSLFIKNHFPLLPMWQLLSCPISLEEFYAQSEIRSDKCSFNFNERINHFQGLSKLEQEAQVLTVAYRMNRTAENRSLLGHAIVDIAIEKKERGEEYFEADMEEYAIEELEAARQMFGIANEHCDFYPWQEKAYVFTSINLVQAYYSLYQEDLERYPFVLSQLEETRLLFEQSNIEVYIKNHVYQLISDYSEKMETVIRKSTLVSP